MYGCVWMNRKGQIDIKIEFQSPKKNEEEKEEEKERGEKGFYNNSHEDIYGTVLSL